MNFNYVFDDLIQINNIFDEPLILWIADIGIAAGIIGAVGTVALIFAIAEWIEKKRKGKDKNPPFPYGALPNDMTPEQKKKAQELALKGYENYKGVKRYLKAMDMDQERMRKSKTFSAIYEDMKRGRKN